MSQASKVFVDTSVQIARFVHSKEIKERINARTSQYDVVVTSEIVKQEFKRRLLKEAQYLLNQLNRLGSLEKVQRHVTDYLPPQQNRKRNICLDLLLTISERSDDADLTERAKSYLSMLLRFGLDDFEDSVQHIERTAGCACARTPVVERRPYKDYDLGKDKCSKLAQCQITAFLIDRKDLTLRILDHLKSLGPDQKTEELQRAEQFLESVAEDSNNARLGDPCLKVGDLMIAMESAGVANFYTLNAKESKHLCRALDQTLVVRPKHPIHEDIVCHPDAQDWSLVLASRGIPRHDDT